MYHKLSLLTKLMIIFLFLFSCKVNNNKSGTSPEIAQPKQNKSLIIQSQPDQPKLNPDQALLKVKVINVEETESTVSYTVKILAVEQRSFGFGSDIKSEEEVVLVSSKSTNAESNSELRCIVEEWVRPGRTDKVFRLIKAL